MRWSALAVLLALGCTGCATGLPGEPREVSHNSARVVGGFVSDTGGDVEHWVEYGPTRAYGSESEHRIDTGVQPNEVRSVGVELLGLERATRYHFRFCAQDSAQEGGPGCSEDRTFTTQGFACGETVTTSIRFTDDVQCFTLNEPGIVIGAPGIEIDMNGFELRAGTFAFDSGAGIDNGGGFDDVTIRDGEITGAPPRGLYAPGILLTGASRNRILNVTIFSGFVGIDIRGGEDNEVRHAELLSPTNVLVAQDTRGLVVADSTAAPPSSDGMRFVNAIDSRIVRNEVVTGGGGRPDAAQFGIYVAGNGNVIKQNRVGGWVGTNIMLASGANNKLLENEVFDATGPINQPAQLAHFSDGLFVGAFTAGTVVRGNTSTGNLLDGIEVQGVDTRIADNTANDNDDLGIEAVAGVTDGGGNSASGNRNPLQCVNVFCQ
jgi:parallel beta-helix repeat protein